MRSAGCFGCLSPHQHLQVQTYLLAVIAGLSTSATGVQTLSVASTCFSCLTKVELIRLKQYLMALWLGLDTSQAGIQTLVKAASCVPCLTPRQQQLVQTYLLTVSAGLPTNSTGVQSIEAGAKCFACLLTKQQYEVQVYILTQLAGVSSTAPSDLASAAKCLMSCLPFELEEMLQTSLITQAAGRLTPPCVTPSAPIAPTAKVVGNTTILIIWNEINTGSLITSYTIKWGTASGVYTNSANVPSTPKSYTITGLTAGTQYFFVVVANSSAAVGCVSANSSEGNATTTGAAPGNHLLNGLVSYWQLAASPAPDLQDGNNLTLAGGTINNPGGIFNGAYLGLGGGVNEGYSVNPAPANMRLGNGASFTCQIWIKPNAAQGHAIAAILGQYSAVAATSAFLAYINAGNIRFVGYSTDATNQDFAVVANPGNVAWHHLIVGYDASIKKLFAQFDGAARVTQATTADLNSVATFFGIGKDAAGGDECGVAVNESGFWSRALSTTEVANLYNGGAGLPFTSFTP